MATAIFIGAILIAEAIGGPEFTEAPAQVLVAFALLFAAHDALKVLK